jgi:hypothetical protein
MMKNAFDNTLRLFILLALIGATAFVNAVFAQGVGTERQVAVIRLRYQEVNDKIGQGLKEKVAGFHYALVTIGGAKDGMQWHAVGNMETSIEFYFDCEPGFDAECGADPRKMLVKIVVNYRAAADLASHAEYVFNNADELVFAYTTERLEAGKTQERRLYFAGGRLIRIARDGKNIDGNFPRPDAEATSNAMAEVKRLRNLFAMMFAEE